MEGCLQEMPCDKMNMYLQPAQFHITNLQWMVKLNYLYTFIFIYSPINIFIA